MDKEGTKIAIRELSKGDQSQSEIAKTIENQTGVATSQSAVARVKAANKAKIDLAGQRLIDKSLDSVIANKLDLIKDGKTIYAEVLESLKEGGNIKDLLAFLTIAQKTEDNILKATGIYQGAAPAVVFNQVNNDNSNNTVISPEVLDIVGKWASSGDDMYVDAEVVDES